MDVIAADLVCIQETKIDMTLIRAVAFIVHLLFRFLTKDKDSYMDLAYIKNRSLVFSTNESEM